MRKADLKKYFSFHPFPLIIAEASGILTFIDIIEVLSWNGVLEIILA